MKYVQTENRQRGAKNLERSEGARKWPSTRTSSPVVLVLAAEQRNTMAFATSSG